MNLKEFLRPDWRKISLFIILMIISAGLDSFVYTTERPEPNPLIVFIQPVFDLPSFILVTFDIIRYIFPANILLSFIYWYFLATLIIWIYDKVKK